MDASAHQITGRVIDEAVTLDGIMAGEHGGDYGDFVMAAFFCTGMAGMAVRFVLDDDGYWLQRSHPLAQQFGGFGAHAGRTFLNGLTVTLP
mgnify:CR=1 FL=1